MKLRWTRQALADFEQAHDFIALDNPETARQIAQRILDATEHLQNNPYIGAVGKGEGFRQWRVDKTPYLLIYAVKNDGIELWRVWHLSRDPSKR